MKAIIFCIKKTYLTDIAIIQILTIKFCVEECFNKNKYMLNVGCSFGKKFGANGFMLRQRLLINRKQRLV
jgi:hypothetical protein